MKLKMFLDKYRIETRVQDEIEYRQVTISQHTGVKYRGAKLGSKIGRKRQFIVDLKKHPNTVMFTRQGLKDGAIGFAPEEVDKCIVTENMPTLSVNTEIVDIDYLKFLLNSNYFLKKINELSIVGSAQKSIHERDLLQLEFEVPSIDIQKEIAKKIISKEKSFSFLKTEIHSQKKIIHQLKQAILQDAIEGKLTQEWREQNPNTEPASELLERIKAEKIQLIKNKKIRKDKPLTSITEDEIPFKIYKNWVWCKLGDVLFYSDSGKSPNCKKIPVKGNEWGVLTTTAIQENKFKEFENKVLPKSFKVNTSQKVLRNDILITRAGPLNRTGISCKVDNINSNLILSDKTIRLVHPPKLMNPDFISQSLNSNLIRKLLVLKMTGMAESQLNISQKNIKLTEFPLPPIEEQKAIVEKVETLLQKCNALELEICQSKENANMLIQAVLKKAFQN